jgi:hypothetical protein
MSPAEKPEIVSYCCGDSSSKKIYFQLIIFNQKNKVKLLFSNAPTDSNTFYVIGNCKTLMQQRSITSLEKNLIQHLIQLIPGNKKKYQIPSIVLPLDDGGMGSLQLNDDSFGRDLIQVQYEDSDGQLVFITLVEGQTGVLFELDMWKVDFSHLLVYPTIDKVEPLV